MINASISYSLVAGPRLIGDVENLTLTGTASIDGFGNALANIITGNSGGNILNGGAGIDMLRGLNGSDNYVVDNSLDVVDEAQPGSGGVDRVTSSVSFSLANTFTTRGQVENLLLTGTGNLGGTGNSLANAITGNGGANVLNGGGGTDWLTGGAGNDNFVFDSALNAVTNVDRITDFSAPADTIRLENAIFTALATPGTLAAAAFHTGAAAHDTSDRIIYNAASGALSYDADGTGAGAAIHFATLNPALAITNADFVVI